MSPLSPPWEISAFPGFSNSRTASLIIDSEECSRAPRASQRHLFLLAHRNSELFWQPFGRPDGIRWDWQRIAGAGGRCARMTRDGRPCSLDRREVVTDNATWLEPAARSVEQLHRHEP